MIYKGRLHFTYNALHDYAGNADGYLIATAAAKNMALVAETSDSTCRKRVKILWLKVCILITHEEEKYDNMPESLQESER